MKDITKFETRDDGLYIGGKKVLAGWESFTGWFWFGTERSHTQDSYLNEKVSIKDDQIWFGFVQGLDSEWGYFSQGEIEALGPLKVWKIKDVDLPHAGRRQ
ncbi:hypothetical protein LCGC14_0460870 [marine sediment metagenome]|uniref:Uncharacterized protein n=1 Tax=marine sediment metagenome TaxID=412755 RepID=A0A0F9SF43_9ZZZZ|nr:hypothetical protein [bacterium]